MKTWWRVLQVGVISGLLLIVGILGLSLGDAVATPALLPAAKAEPVMVPQSNRYVYLPLVSRFHDSSYVNPFGVTMYGPVSNAAGLDVMRAAGARRATTSLYWDQIEPTKGTFNWTSFDTKAQNAQAAGMELFVLFTGNPSWAATYPGGPVTDTQDLLDFVQAMVQRYNCDGIDDAPGSPCVRDWSFYAEPDNGDPVRAERGKGLWGYHGVKFAEMLSQVAPVIHAADPHARVLIGGLAYDYFVEDGGPFVRSFLTDTLQALNGYPGGASAYIDAVAFHFYPVAPDRWPTIREKALEIRGIMQRHGVGHLPLLCPEMGFWSSPEFSSSKNMQANRLVQMFVRGLSVGIEASAWYKVSDTAREGSDADLNPDRTSGLLDVDGNPKPSYYAYRTMTQELTGARYVRRLQVPGAEGYVFRMPNGSEKTVVWSTGSSATVTFPHACLRMVDRSGSIYQPIVDGDPNWDADGAVNGRIVLRVFPEPRYVSRCP